MKRNTLIEHKEVAIVCEESGLVSLSYNVLLITPEANVVVKPIVPTITVKSTLTRTNCVKPVIQWKPIMIGKERY
jgi:hypothetical protein